MCYRLAILGFLRYVEKFHFNIIKVRIFIWFSTIIQPIV